MKDLVPCEVVDGDQLFEARVLGPKFHGGRVVIFSGPRAEAEYISKALNNYARREQIRESAEKGEKG